MIIIIDVHNSFNFDNYHDGWLIGDHIMMIMDPDCDLRHWFTSLIDYDEKHDWQFIDHEWWLMIIIIDDDNGRSS